MIGPTNFRALPKKNSWALPDEFNLIKPARDCVSFYP